MNSLGFAIRSARVRSHLSQGELSARLGVSQGTISFWERGIEVPTLDNLLKLLVQFPELVEPIRAYHQPVMARLRQIERILFDGKCACGNCNCQSAAESGADKLVM